MTVTITLTIAGPDTGPFNLYSDVDNFTVPFETNVNKTALQAGYTTSLVPDTATTIRVKSVSECVNHTDIVLQNTTTTTTTGVPCSGTASSGGTGVTEQAVSLDVEGGVVIFQVSGQGVPDKFEILHDNIKMSTSSMSASPTNSGPFDNIYGSPTVPPDAAAVAGIPQFIGTSKGTVPTRKAEFDAANPALTYIDLSGGYQQLIWWKYTSGDYLVNASAILRVTGPSGTAWDVQRLCPTSSTTSTTSSTSSTTTTTTTVAPTLLYNITEPFPTGDAACATPTYGPNVYSKSAPTVGATFYVDVDLTVPLAGGGNFYKLELVGPVTPGPGPVIIGATVGQINGSGVLYQGYTCPP